MPKPTTCQNNYIMVVLRKFQNLNVLKNTKGHKKARKAKKAIYASPKNIFLSKWPATGLLGWVQGTSTQING